MEQEMEMQLWEYIDGICCEADAVRIALRISEHSAWGEKYAELMSVNAEIAGSLELEQPSMRFTKNVMEAVAATHMAPAAKKYINPFIIRGIAALFVLMILSILFYAFATASYTNNESNLLSGLNLSKFDYTGLYNSVYLKVFVMVNILLALALADGFIKRRQQTNL